ncbi:protein YhfH [Bacillus fonticola]|nr:protein YhfH [Bacillus fonticola]
MKPVLEFFRQLPPKVCHQCGEKIDEQADCYQNTCHRCVDEQPPVM